MKRRTRIPGHGLPDHFIHHGHFFPYQLKYIDKPHTERSNAIPVIHKRLCGFGFSICLARPMASGPRSLKDEFLHDTHTALQVALRCPFILNAVHKDGPRRENQ